MKQQESSVPQDVPQSTQSSARAAARRSGSTRDRIIQRSIQLFNRNGLSTVTIIQIAEALEMSPGNLTYHFPRKADLIAATLAFMKQRLQDALAKPAEVWSARDGAAYLIRLYRILWDLRFFFNALTYVLGDPDLRREYSAFHAWLMRTLEDDLRAFYEKELFVAPVEPNNFSLLAANMWSQWLNWLRMQQVRTPMADTPDDAGLYDCALHNWSLCQSWMEVGYARELLQAFDEFLPLKNANALR